MREGLGEPPTVGRLLWLFQDSINPQQLLFSAQHLQRGGYSEAEKLSAGKTHQLRKRFYFQQQPLLLEKDG